MSKEFFYNIAFRNVSGGNILQNRIALKPDVSFGAKGKCPWQRLQTKIEIWLLRTKTIGALRKLLENGFLGQLTHPIIYAAVLEYC